MEEDQYFGEGKPIDRHVRVRITRDRDGNEIVEYPERESIFLGPNGSTDRVDLERDYHFHCGCPRGDGSTAGGICTEPGCSKLSCQNCFGRCLNCGKGLCLECSFWDRGQNEDRYCKRCFDAERRRRRSNWFVRLILSPFVDFKEEE